MPGNYYKDDCEASNSSTGDDSQGSDSIVLNPRKLHNKYLNVSKSKSKTNIKVCQNIRKRKKKSIVQETHRAVSSCDVEAANETFKTSPRLSVSSKYVAEDSLITSRDKQSNYPNKTRHKTKMHHRRHEENEPVTFTSKDMASGEGPHSVQHQDSNESKRVFPFLQTPSGNLKIGPNQVVFESKKVSILVADPTKTTVDVKTQHNDKTFANGSEEDPRPIIYGSEKGSRRYMDGEIKELMTVNEQTCFKNNIDNYIEDYVPSQLQKEFSLQRLSSTTLPAVDWNKTPLPFKTELFTRLLHRITNYINPDVEVLISKEVFSCHLLVLQCYSDYFDQAKQASKVRLPEDSVTPRAFMTIYNWMIYPGSDSFRLLSRENILEVFVASQNLGIKELEEQCWTFINSDNIFSEETAFLLYLKAKEMNNSIIMQLMIPRIMRFFLKLVGTTNFVDLDIDDVCVLLRSNFIAVHNEIEVFMSAVRWLMHDWIERRSYLGEIMKCVRFGWIEPWQLVDIRRNPENPEFMKVTCHSEVQQLIEDGLSYAIIKYWYGNETQDYYHWIDLLGLQEPHQRNWIDEEKNFVTYREFLNDLEVYQQAGTLDTIQLRSQQISSKTDAFPPPPTVAEFMAQRGKNLEELVEKNAVSKEESKENDETEGQSTTSNSQEKISTHFQNSRLHDFYICNNFQTTFENSERNFIEMDQHNMKREESEQNICSKGNSTNAQELKLSNIPFVNTELQLTLDPFGTHQAQQKNIWHHKEDLPSISDSLDMKQKISQMDDRSLNKKEILVEKIFENTDEKHINSTIPQKHEQKISSLFTRMSKDSLQSQHHINQINISILGSSYKNYLMEGSLFFPDEEAILVFGGIDPHSPYGLGRNTGKDVYRYRPHVNSWELVGELPDARHHHAVALLKGKIFLAGGTNPREDNIRGKSVALHTVWSYDPLSRSWAKESEMQTPRKNFALVVSNGKLYAIGGQDKQGCVLSSVECFNPTVGVWEEVAPLTVGRMGVAATKFRDFIWVAGGMTSSKCSSLCSNVECYDTRRNVWLPNGALRYSQCFGQLFAMNDTLYTIGGAGCLYEKVDNTASIGAVDVWDQNNKKWHLKDEMAIPRHGHSLAYLGTQILIIGGVTTMYMRALSNVECFCCVRGTWVHGVANLPTPLSGHGSVTLPPASLMQ